MITVSCDICEPLWLDDIRIDLVAVQKPTMHVPSSASTTFDIAGAVIQIPHTTQCLFCLMYVEARLNSGSVNNCALSQGYHHLHNPRDARPEEARHAKVDISYPYVRSTRLPPPPPQRALLAPCGCGPGTAHLCSHWRDLSPTKSTGLASADLRTAEQ